MKNQYVGDVNDYRKYGLIRALIGDWDIKVGVCWMLTPPDGRTDGDFLNYLHSPDSWEHYDSNLYGTLHEIIKTKKDRDIKRIEQSNILFDTEFYSDILADDAGSRSLYFRNLFAQLNGVDLIFCDPDNGFEVKSTPLGRKNSSKYLYWAEFNEIYSMGYSVLVYQHFTREARESFIERLSKRIKTETASQSVYSFRTSHVVFFLAAQERHKEYFEQKLPLVSKQWDNQITGCKQ
ncbi:MAG TPA: hypothetical protein ENH23_04985 [candidate division Zixibacteria bacterium]|nr:hypothetical protein [candidate division Zixibacteria bacterium]